MNHCAIKVFEEFSVIFIFFFSFFKLKDIIIAYGQSDEYSFILKKDTSLFSRRIK